ncbi:lycopene cyclase family protein [Sphingosinicella sp. CPCC 101087]|uniref:lycopene cyclase family protein n=1 Tax=Sphingosinicella sp. CPCC 101087 TaxID=2497754 RepID=UPI00101BCB48|nr:lycopene cyclase family protein [Sphingosinicella sp. CPCC 101087]
MGRGQREGVLIAGGGVAGCLAALAMARLRPEVPLTIVEESDRFGGDGFHHLFEAELEEAERTIAADLIEQSWPGFYVAFPDVRRNLKAPLGGFEAAVLHQAMLETLRPDQYRLGTRVVAMRSDALELDGGETIRGDGAIDARGPANLSTLDLLYEARVERIVRLEAPHRLDRPLLADATGEQSIGLTFIQAFPIDAERLRIAKVLISERVQADEAAPARLDHYLTTRGWRVAESQACPAPGSARPLPTGGDFGAYWRIGGARVAKLGLRGGFVQPTTGRTAPDALRNALLLAAQRDFSGDALHDVFEDQAKQTWRRREPQRGVLAAVAAAGPAERRALLEQIYRLDPGTILRFHTDRLGLLDRRRIQQAVRNRSAAIPS